MPTAQFFPRLSQSVNLTLRKVDDVPDKIFVTPCRDLGAVGRRGGNFPCIFQHTHELSTLGVVDVPCLTGLVDFLSQQVNLLLLRFVQAPSDVIRINSIAGENLVRGRSSFGLHRRVAYDFNTVDRLTRTDLWLLHHGFAQTRRTDRTRYKFATRNTKMPRAVLHFGFIMHFVAGVVFVHKLLKGGCLRRYFDFSCRGNFTFPFGGSRNRFALRGFGFNFFDNTRCLHSRCRLLYCDFLATYPLTALQNGTNSVVRGDFRTL